MPKAVVDPDELARFAASLRRFSDTGRGELTAISRQFSRLGDTWQDEEHERFAAQFDEMVRVLLRFFDEADRQVPVLGRKAEAIRAYLGQGGG